ncbi:Na+-driven multidrug efflux pump [Elizabethkingia sp. YR214]|uniref:hypothetical protein n=1 Tax=Elizabethkingia sp. YR214 TaxID=2135667 RepID=UPI000D2FF404|nr:hypothetical protein [Elizabethkingia sp. YR214]PUB28500.1 Na+-driven multidrug efflux pump [Elizabethkingia sp. YR214]
MKTENTKRIVKNSLLLYVQMILSMLVALYTSRIILKVMGVDDFGIYNVVGGIVTMFGILNGAMSSSTTRFLTFALGEDNAKKLQTVFSTSLIIHILIGIVICILTGTIGLWFLDNKMQIPVERLNAAKVVFYCSIASAFISVINVPYSAMIIAHEKFSAFTYLSLVELTLKIGVVIFLQYNTEIDSLKLYAYLLLIIQFILQIGYFLYCYIEFSEIRGRIILDKKLFKEMTSFAGWSLFGDSAFMMQNQGVNMLINVFFGTTVNAARGIAIQVQGLVIRFISSFQTALNPQITKSYASRDLDYMHQLIYNSSKYSFYLFLLLALPILIETNFLLELWLTIVPEHAVNFVRITLLVSIISCLANPLVFAVKATGKIRRYEMILGSVSLTLVPLAYIALRYGATPEVVFVIQFVIECVGQLIRLLMAAPLIGLSLKEYFLKVFVRCNLILVLSILMPLFICYFFNDSLLRLILVAVVSTISIILAVYYLGMGSKDKGYVKLFIISRIKKTFISS